MKQIHDHAICQKQIGSISIPKTLKEELCLPGN